jgi:hypothetical protein
MIWILVSLKSVNYFSSIENFPKRDIPAAKIPINAHGKTNIYQSVKNNLPKIFNLIFFARKYGLM